MPVLRRVGKTSIGGKRGHIPSELERFCQKDRGRESILGMGSSFGIVKNSASRRASGRL